MTSPPPTRGAAPRFRCRACGRTLTAAQAVLEHCRDVYAARPAICRGVLEPISGDQLVPVGAGGGDEAGDRRHVDSIATATPVVDVNRPASGGPSGSVDFTERNHA